MLNRKKLAFLVFAVVAVGVVFYSASWERALKASEEARIARYVHAENVYFKKAHTTKEAVLKGFYDRCTANKPACMAKAQDSCNANKVKSVFRCNPDAICDCLFTPLIAMPKPTLSSYASGFGGAIKALLPLFRDIIFSAMFAVFLVFGIPRWIQT